MNLRVLEYLIALAENKHFGKAAESCHVNQSTLSIQIKKFEEELGVELIERNPMRIGLTRAGEQVLKHAYTVIQETSAIKITADRMKDPETATIRLGIFPTIGPYLLPHIISKFKKKFPNLELLLTEEKSENIIAGLQSGRLDVGILASPVTSTKLEKIYLFNEDFVLAVPDSHPLANRSKEIAVEELAEYQLLLLDEGHCLRDQALEVCKLAGISERTDFRSTSLETLRQMVAAGTGITLLPRLSVVKPVPNYKNITILELKKPKPTRKIGIFWPKFNPYRELFPKIAGIIQQTPNVSPIIN